MNDSAAAIELAIDAPVRQRIDAAWVVERARQAARMLPCAVKNIELLVVDDARMGELHRTHLGDPATTDVLTFDLGEGGTAGLDVQLVVCADVAARQAAERSHPIEREILLYIVHGLLHCAGYDDHTAAGHARMHQEEDRILEEIGVGRVFGRGAGDPPGA